jgi:hypothetical protein
MTPLGKVFMVYMMLWGAGAPTRDEARFNNRSGCELYLHTQYADSIREAFQLACVDVTPPICQGQRCE